jgi:hypothetical protein
MRRFFAITLALCLLFLTAACQEEEGTTSAGAAPQQPSSAPIPTQPMIEPPPPGSGAGDTALIWETPADWEAVTPDNRMRKAQYRVPGEAGDAECVVFYFGPGQGGDPLANAQRWANQFTLSDGRPGTADMKMENRNVGDIEILTVEVSGTYEGAGFGMGRPKPAPIPNQMLLGAVAKGPDANWFFKLTGPEATVTAQRSAFEAMVGSLKRGR